VEAATISFTRQVQTKLNFKLLHALGPQNTGQVCSTYLLILSAHPIRYMRHQCNLTTEKRPKWFTMRSPERIDCAHLPMPAWFGATVSDGIFPTTSNESPIPTAAVSGRRHPRSWWSNVHRWQCHCRWLCVSGGCSLEAASGTVCCPTSPQLQRCFSEPPQNLSIFPTISFVTVFGF